VQRGSVALRLTTKMQQERDRGATDAAGLLDDERVENREQCGPVEVEHLRGDSQSGPIIRLPEPSGRGLRFQGRRAE
jgi:hypothetical protein